MNLIGFLSRWAPHKPLHKKREKQTHIWGTQSRLPPANENEINEVLLGVKIRKDSPFLFFSKHNQSRCARFSFLFSLSLWGRRIFPAKVHLNSASSSPHSLIEKRWARKKLTTSSAEECIHRLLCVWEKRQMSSGNKLVLKHTHAAHTHNKRRTKAKRRRGFRTQSASRNPQQYRNREKNPPKKAKIEIFT